MTSSGLRILPADDRFHELGAHAEPDGGEYLRDGYRCPDGPPGVSFRWRDIADRTTWGSNLSDIEVDALEPATRAALGGDPPRSGDRVAIDVRCPRCSRPVVVIFRDVDLAKDWWSFEPVIVLELDQPASGDIREH